MTVVSALLCDDCVLMGSDSQITESEGLKYQRSKLAFRADFPVAWGFAGDEGLGLQFGDWMRAQSVEILKTPATLLDAATAEVARLNGKRRSMNKLAEVETTKNDLFDALIAGYIGGVPFVLELDSRGVATDVTTEPLSAIGSGKPHIKIAHVTASHMTSKLSRDARLLGFLMEVAINCAVDCGLPARLLKIQPEGVSELSK